jgi:hypothetical protein
MSIDWKVAVRASSFRNEPRRNGLVLQVSPDHTIKLSPDDRIFLNKQRDRNEDGVYVVGKYPQFLWKRSPDLPLGSDQYLAGILDDYNMKTWIQINQNVVGSSSTCWIPEEEYLEYVPKRNDDVPKRNDDVPKKEYTYTPIRKPPSKDQSITYDKNGVPTADLLGLGD